MLRKEASKKIRSIRGHLNPSLIFNIGFLLKYILSCFKRIIWTYTIFWIPHISHDTDLKTVVHFHDFSGALLWGFFGPREIHGNGRFVAKSFLTSFEAYARNGIGSNNFSKQLRTLIFLNISKFSLYFNKNSVWKMSEVGGGCSAGWVRRNWQSLRINNYSTIYHYYIFDQVYTTVLNIQLTDSSTATDITNSNQPISKQPEQWDTGRTEKSDNKCGQQTDQGG